MVSMRVHISTIVAVFVALGIGLVIGGTMGPSLVLDAQGQLLQSVQNRYKELAVQHEQLEGELHNYHSLTRLLAPEMNGLRIVWQGNRDQQADHLIERLRQLGAVVTIENADLPASEWVFEPDLLLIAESAAAEQMSIKTVDEIDDAGSVMNDRSLVPVLDIREHGFHGSVPENTAHLIKLVQRTLMEKEAPHAASVSHYSSME